MELLNHDLAHEFPEYASKMHELKTKDAHFAKLFDGFDELNHQIKNLEDQGVPIADEGFAQLKRSRLKLKDEIYHYLIKQ